MAVKARAQHTIVDMADTMITSAIAPVEPSVDLIWLDINVLPGILKRWNGSGWDVIVDSSNLNESVTTQETRIDQLNDALSLKADKTATDALAKTVSDNYTELKLESSGLLVTIGQEKQAAVEIASGDLDAFVSWVKGWMAYDGLTLSLGRSDSQYKTEITNTRLAFTYQGTTLAYFDGDHLVVPWAELEQVTMMARNTSGVPAYYLDIQFDGTSYSGTLRG